jgi:archaellum component FlaD/FlaE
MGQISETACKANPTHTWGCNTSPISLLSFQEGEEEEPNFLDILENCITLDELCEEDKEENDEKEMEKEEEEKNEKETEIEEEEKDEKEMEKEEEECIYEGTATRSDRQAVVSCLQPGSLQMPSGQISFLITCSLCRNGAAVDLCCFLLFR